MVFGVDVGNVGAMFASVGGGLWTIAKVFFGLGIVGLLGWFVWDYFSYNRKVIVRKIVGGRSKIYEDMAKKTTDDDGVSYWKLRKVKVGNSKKIDTPPDEAIDINHKGREMAECWITENGNVIWATDNFDPEQHLKVGEAGKATKGKKNNSFQPVSTSQRASLARQLEKAKKYNANNFLERYGAIITNGLIMIVIFGMFLMFFGKAVEPSIEMGKVVNSQLQSQKEIVETQKELKQDIEVIRQNMEEENQGEPVQQQGGGG